MAEKGAGRKCQARRKASLVRPRTYSAFLAAVAEHRSASEPMLKSDREGACADNQAVTSVLSDAHWINVKSPCYWSAAACDEIAQKNAPILVSTREARP